MATDLQLRTHGTAAALSSVLSDTSPLFSYLNFYLPKSPFPLFFECFTLLFRFQVEFPPLPSAAKQPLKHSVLLFTGMVCAAPTSQCQAANYHTLSSTRQGPCTRVLYVRSVHMGRPRPQLCVSESQMQSVGHAAFSSVDQGPLPKPHGASTVQFFSAGCFQLPGDNCRPRHVAASVFKAGLESLPHLNLSGKKSPLSPQDLLYKSGPPQIATTPVTCLETTMHL